MSTKNPKKSLTFCKEKLCLKKQLTTNALNKMKLFINITDIQLALQLKKNKNSQKKLQLEKLRLLMSKLQVCPTKTWASYKRRINHFAKIFTQSCN